MNFAMILFLENCHESSQHIRTILKVIIQLIYSLQLSLKYFNFVVLAVYFHYLSHNYYLRFILSVDKN